MSETSPRSTLRLVFWPFGILLALFQAWAFRYGATADSISYLDMSDGAMPGADWHRLINGTWSPLYPFLMGLFRRVLHSTPSNEIIAAHFLNILIFILAFACFEFFLTRLLKKLQPLTVTEPPDSAFSCSIFLTLAYSLFLWSSFSSMSLRYLRPDMLMSCFVFLAVGMLLKLSARPAAWMNYLKLGLILGVGFLAKAPMLPIAVLMLTLSLFLVESWRPALKMVFASFALILLIGSLYFVPLSHLRRKFTLGESGAYNYLVNVDRAGPGEGWYLEDPGKGVGEFLHPPQRIFESPPVYAFDRPGLVTHPLRFDPSEWMTGVRARFDFKRQVGQSYANIIDMARPLRRLIILLVALLSAAFVLPRKQIGQPILAAWPVLLIGVAGPAMYVIVHVESRYIGVFLVLILCPIIYGFVQASHVLNRYAVTLVTIVIVASLLRQGVHRDYVEYKNVGRGPNQDALAATALLQEGVLPGDRVARISSSLMDFGPERIGRLEVIAEVDFQHANEFWASPVDVQEQILHLFTSRGAKAVIATRPDLSPPGEAGWKHLAGKYWAWLGPPRKGSK